MPGSETTGRPGDVAASVIGRNEGQKLALCLAALNEQVSRIVYVDSGSTDGSRELARDLGAEVIELDLSIPFTAARARNEGLARLRDDPAIAFVQILDGDCEVRPGWVATARAFMEDHPRAAAVAGRRRERYPDASIWNRMIDEEWGWQDPDGAPAQARSVMGDALLRLAAIDEVGPFDPTILAGEEPELCVRLRAAGWEIWRMPVEMSLHDVGMTRFSQWWQRTRRTGHSYAEGVFVRGRNPDHVARLRRTLIWGLALPLATLAGLFVSPWALVLLLAYPAQIARLVLRQGMRPVSAAFMVLGKIPEAYGVLTWIWRRLKRQEVTLIEYRDVPDGAGKNR